MIDIEALAREAGILMNPAGPGDHGIDTYYGDNYLPSGALAHFAALVAEECARQAERSSSAEHAGLRIRTAFPVPKE